MHAYTEHGMDFHGMGQVFMLREGGGLARNAGCLQCSAASAPGPVQLTKCTSTSRFQPRHPTAAGHKAHAGGCAGKWTA